MENAFQLFKVIKMKIQYFVPFKAQQGVDAQFALKEKLLNIEGIAIDSSVNSNKWQIPAEDLDFLTQSLAGAQLRVDHAESALMIMGKVAEAKRDGDRVLFRAEVGEEKLIEKILRGYVTHVSVQVDSEDVECSKCKRSTRKEGMLIHLCPGAWEIVHKPTVRELSIVASPAYKTTDFQPVGFFAAMNDAQWDAIVKSVTDSQSLDKGDDVGSNREVQEPEKQKLKAKEVKHMSVKADKDASPHQAQGVVNVAPGETAPKQVEYQDLMNQLQQLEKQIREGHPSASDSEIDALNKKIGELETEIGKRARKRELSKKLSELTKKFSEEEATPEEEGKEEGEEAKVPKAEAEAKRASGKGIVAVDEISRDMLGNYDWFKDLLKAHKKLVGFQ
jgi:chemotaxis protein histidine kinase CheA